MHRSHSRHTYRMDKPVPVSESRWWKKPNIVRDRPSWWCNSQGNNCKKVERHMHQRKQRQWNQKIIREELQTMGEQYD